MNLDFRNSASLTIDELAGDAFTTMKVSIEIIPVDISVVLGDFIGTEECAIYENKSLKAISAVHSNVSGSEGPAFISQARSFRSVEISTRKGYELGQYSIVALPLKKKQSRSSGTSRSANASFKAALSVALQKACSEADIALDIPRSSKKQYFLDLADKVIVSIKDSDFNLHHMIPKEFGGTDDYYNLLLLPKAVHDTYNQWIYEQMAGVAVGETVDFKVLFNPSPLAFSMDFFRDFTLKGIPNSPQILSRAFSYLAECRMLVPFGGMFVAADDAQQIGPARTMVCRPSGNKAIGLSVPLFY